MIQELIQIIKAELVTNDFMSGGLAVAAFSGLLYISRQIPTRIYNFVDRNLVWTIRINNGNTFYESFNLWAFDFLKENTKRLKVESSTRQEKFLGINYGVHWRFLRGSLIVVRLEIEEASDTILRKESIIIKIYSLKGQSQFKRIMSEASNFESNSITNPFIYDYRWGHWEKVKPITKRKIESIFTEKGIKTKILENINTFLNNKDLYEQIGLNYKYSMIFYGDPGTGKSSLISALGSHYKRNLCYLDISTVESGNYLKTAFATTPENSILIFEDIDCYESLEARKGGNSVFEEINLSTILQLMDGMYLPDGTVVIATTNHLDKLDKALIREGRFDRKIELKKANKELALKMCEYINPDRKEEIEMMKFPASQAKIQGILIK